MLISIIIPCYNAQDYIEECVASAFNQSYKNIEVICIDNNSTDQTWAKLLQLKNKYPQLVIDKETKPGASAARNKGLSLSKGDWIQFLDADDLLLPDKILHQAQLINSKISFIVGNFFINEKPQMIRSNDSIWTLLATTGIGNTCANLFSKKILVQVGGWDYRLKSSQEYNLMFRLLKLNPSIAFSSGIDTIIRVQANSISTNRQNQVGNLIRRIQLTFEILAYYKAEVKEYSKTDEQKIKQSLFSAIRELYFYNKKEAFIYYKKLRDYSFKPTIDEANTRNYIITYRLFGFKLSNEFSRIPKVIRNLTKQ